jgi:glutamine synthetase
MSLTSLIETLETQFNLRPVIAAEVEFYMMDELSEATILERLNQICADCLPAEKERGEKQYEIATIQCQDIPLFCKRLNELRETIHANFDADFSAKPFPDDYGSALHFHLHLEDEAGHNQFTRTPEGAYSKPLLHSLGGLLATMQENLSIFSPNDRSRFAEPGKHSPTHLSWGPNNRSVALRLPDKPLDQKHIEHRLASADAEVIPCVEALLQGVVYGLTHESDPGDPIYGNAWDKQYGLKQLAC